MTFTKKNPEAVNTVTIDPVTEDAPFTKIVQIFLREIALGEHDRASFKLGAQNVTEISLADDFSHFVVMFNSSGRKAKMVVPMSNIRNFYYNDGSIRHANQA